MKMDIMNEVMRMAREVDEALMPLLNVGSHERLRLAVNHLPKSGGKRLRPSMAIVVAEAVGKKGKTAVPFACALEIVHNFTLVHDDIIDEDLTRRGKPTVHAQFDVPTAIIAGDALFAIGFQALAKTEVDGGRLRQLLKDLAETVFLIAEGEQMDMDFENSPEVTVDAYMEMVEKKTAVLFACAAGGGAIIGKGSKKQIRDMREYGRLLGIGFQIWDDVLGLVGNERVLGKPVGSDIRNGKRTLIVVHAMQTLGAKGRKKHAVVLKALGNEKATDEEVRQVIQLFTDIGSLDHAKNIALQYAEQAKALLDCLKPSKERDFLREIVDFSVGREL
jgi:geranylgeranyl diphosphate synthase type I